MINVSLLLYWLLQMGVAFLSTITFAIIFHTPRKEWLCCGFTGAVGWLGVRGVRPLWAGCGHGLFLCHPGPCLVCPGCSPFGGRPR